MLWKQKVMRFVEMSNHVLGDEFRCAVVMRYTPEKVKAHFKLLAVDVTDDYRKLREVVFAFEARNRSFDEQGRKVSEDVAVGAEKAMEVDVIKGKPKDKGKGKGGKAQTGEFFWTMFWLWAYGSHPSKLSCVKRKV